MSKLVGGILSALYIAIQFAIDEFVTRSTLVPVYASPLYVITYNNALVFIVLVGMFTLIGIYCSAVSTSWRRWLLNWAIMNVVWLIIGYLVLLYLLFTRLTG